MKGISIPGTEKEDVIIPQDTRLDKRPKGTLTTKEGIEKVIILEKVDTSKGKENVIEDEGAKEVNPIKAQIDEDASIAL